MRSYRKTYKSSKVCSEKILKKKTVCGGELLLKNVPLRRFPFSRMFPFPLDLPKRKVLMKAFITSQFSYCPLIWMLHSRTLNNRINNIHERALRLTYKDNKSSFKQLLEKDHSVTVHPKNVQVLVTEIFKVKNNLAPNIMNDVFELKEPPYNLQSESNQNTSKC